MLLFKSIGTLICSQWESSTNDKLKSFSHISSLNESATSCLLCVWNLKYEIWAVLLWTAPIQRYFVRNLSSSYNKSHPKIVLLKCGWIQSQPKWWMGWKYSRLSSSSLLHRLCLRFKRVQRLKTILHKHSFNAYYYISWLACWCYVYPTQLELFSITRVVFWETCSLTAILVFLL